MSYTAVCRALRADRKKEDAALAERARKEYGDDFKYKFQYRSSKHGDHRAMTKDSAIAKEYRRLHGQTT